MKRLTTLCLLSFTVLPACGDEPTDQAFGESLRPEPLDILLAYEPDVDDAIDRRIAQQQEQLKDNSEDLPTLERLGALFIAKARTASDPGCFELARQCAARIEQVEPGNTEGRLIDGLVLHQMHRFAEAEAIARELAARRGSFQDLGLLGDVLLDRGAIEEAQRCYQSMLDLKPCLQSYARAARIGWLQGDVDSARQLLELAIRAGSPRDAEALAWVTTELSRIELAAGDVIQARSAAAAALVALPDYPPALLALGRVQAAEGDLAAAEKSLRTAAKLRAEPEYLWALEEILRAAGNDAGAAEVAAHLARSGEREDPRTFAVYLATHAIDTERALELTAAELTARTDVFTHDARAWALHAAGQHDAAHSEMEHALAHNTPEPRLWYHAGVIAASRGDRDSARTHLRRAVDASIALTPAERADLQRQLSAL